MTFFPTYKIKSPFSTCLDSLFKLLV
jgi:hypothetical protein